MSDPTTPPGPPGRPLPPPPSPAERAVVADPSAWLDGPRAPASRPRRVGQLSFAWQAATVAAWSGVFVAYLAVWKASEEIGLSTWWLGARSDPQPLVIRLTPFFIAALFGILASYNVRRMPWIGVAGAVVLAAVAAPDLARSAGLATVEFAIAGAVLVIALASCSGTYRAPHEQPDR